MLVALTHVSTRTHGFLDVYCDTLNILDILLVSYSHEIGTADIFRVTEKDHF